MQCWAKHAQQQASISLAPHKMLEVLNSSKYKMEASRWVYVHSFSPIVHLNSWNLTQYIVKSVLLASCVQICYLSDHYFHKNKAFYSLFRFREFLEMLDIKPMEVLQIHFQLIQDKKNECKWLSLIFCNISN